MKTLQMYNAPENCDSGLPVVSIPSNDPESTADTTSFAFYVILDQQPVAHRTRLALDFPPECILRAASRPPSGAVAVTATASGWTGSRRLFFRLRASTYLAPLRRAPVLLNATTFRVTLWTSETSPGIRKCDDDEKRAACREPASYRHRSLSQSGLCRWVPLNVQFWRIGWDHWVLAPSSYLAGQCVGHCGSLMSKHVNTTNHAMVLSRFRSMQPDMVIPDACCVPVDYASQSMLYVDAYDRVVLKAFPNMIVAQCGCR
ncbi:growth/differentiation factor 6-like [Haemaphysalis longicornis]